MLANERSCAGPGSARFSSRLAYTVCLYLPARGRFPKCAVLNSPLPHQNLRCSMVMLHDFIAANRDKIIARCREKATGRSDSPPGAGDD